MEPMTFLVADYGTIRAAFVAAVQACENNRPAYIHEMRVDGDVVGYEVRAD